jgi:hypothetical protein
MANSWSMAISRASNMLINRRPSSSVASEGSHSCWSPAVISHVTTLEKSISAT